MLKNQKPFSRLLNLIVTALRQEARPLIESLCLKQDHASKKIPVYASGDALLVISGMGKVSAAIATTHLLHLSGSLNDSHLVNVGMCGAAVDRISLGEAVAINKIWDHRSGREFFPDMLLNHNLQEASLGTFDVPVTNDRRSELVSDVVDMEGAAVFQAGQMFVPPHQMTFIKVATDYLEVSSDDFPQMLRYYEQSLEKWLPILQNTEELGVSVSVMDEEQKAHLESLVEGLRLTATQTHQLRDAAMRYLVRGGQDLNILKPMIVSNPKHKALRNKILKSMIAVLDG